MSKPLRGAPGRSSSLRSWRHANCPQTHQFGVEPFVRLGPGCQVLVYDRTIHVRNGRSQIGKLRLLVTDLCRRSAARL